MNCPFCRHHDSRVMDSRTSDDGAMVRRRRQCPSCERRFTTVEAMTLAVVKQSGVTEPFSRQKIVDGVRKACQGRPVDEDQHGAAQQDRGDAVVVGGAQAEVGLALLVRFRELDEVAYLRFASVYRSFESLTDFEAEISLLRAEHGDTVPEPEPRSRSGSSTTLLGRATCVRQKRGRAGRGSPQPEGTSRRRHDGDGQRPGIWRRSRRCRARPHGRAHLHHGWAAPLRPGHLGTSRRRSDELAGRGETVSSNGAWSSRTSGRSTRLDHRDDQVLPRCGRGSIRIEGNLRPADRPGRAHVPSRGRGARLLRDARRRRGVRARADVGCWSTRSSPSTARYGSTSGRRRSNRSVPVSF